MKYYKNIELAKMYQVSIDTISNWIHSSIEGKLELQLYNSGKRIYIVDSPFNHYQLKNLAEKSRRFKNKKYLKPIQAADSFYSTYSDKDIINIIRGIDLEREIPLKYCFFGCGAALWNQQAEAIWAQQPGTVLPNTKSLLRYTKNLVEDYLENYSKINIIEIGPGNAIPSRELIKQVFDSGKLGKYIAYDISTDMQEFAHKNLITWFGKDFPYEFYCGDITRDSFPELVFSNSIAKTDNGVCNMFLFIGGEIENDRLYQEQLKNIAKSMGKNDILILEHGLDNDRSKHNFTFYEETAPINNEDLKFRGQVLDYLGITPDTYDVERYYSYEKKAKVVDIVLECDYKISVDINKSKYQLLLNKNEHITIWRYNSHTYLDVINEIGNAGFELVMTSTTVDGSSIIVVGRLQV